MKVVAFVLLLAFCAIECRKAPPINKNANLDFIAMESGGGASPNNPAARPNTAAPVSSQKPEPPKTPVVQPKPPTPIVTTAKPVPVAITTTLAPGPIKPLQPKPAQSLPNQMNLKPVPASSGQAGGVTTPGHGNVQQLITYYDSKGKASVIRPYTYSAAVKQG